MPWCQRLMATTEKPPHEVGKRPLEDDDEETPLKAKMARTAEEAAALSTQCPYLDTIDR